MLSIVIPTLNAASHLGQTISHIRGGAEGLALEIIVVDGGSSDETAQLAELLGARVFTTGKGRGHQLATGAAKAAGTWLLFLHADTRLPNHWRRAVSAHVTGHSQQAGYFRLAFDATGLWPRLVAGGANLRARLFGLPYGDQGLLISRQMYDLVGGFSDLPLMEDVEIVRHMGRARLRCLGTNVVTSAERYMRDGWLRRLWRNQRCLWMYLRGVPVDRIVRTYQ